MDLSLEDQELVVGQEEGEVLGLYVDRGLEVIGRRGAQDPSGWVMDSYKAIQGFCIFGGY